MSILRPKLTDSELLRRHPAAGAFIAAGVTGVCLLAEPWLGHRPALFIYLAAIVLAGPMIDRAGVFIMAAVSALAWNFFFTAPLFTFYMNDREDIALLVLFFVITFAAARMARSAREHEVAVRGDEERRRSLYEITRELTSGEDSEKSATAALRRLGEAYDAEVSVIRFAGDGKKVVAILGAPAGEDLIASSRGALEERLPVGRHVEIPENENIQHYPLPMTRESAVLTLRFRSARPGDADRAEALRIIAHLFALALER